MEPAVVSVFGSSAPAPGSERYEEAREVGRRLAQAGFAVATGGYGGTMAGVSLGASEAGGHVIGVTSSRIEAYRPTPANQWVADEVRYDTQHERLLHLVTRNVGMITLSGGVGTLSEMALAWSLLQVGELPPRPLILLGAGWEQVIESIGSVGFLRPEDRALLSLVDSAEAAVAILRHQVKDAENGVDE